MNIPIVFEDASLIVIDKPAGVVVNRADTTGNVETIQDWAENYVEKNTPDEEFNARSGIVHRLDKDTSGLLVIAKTPESFQNLKNQFKSREVVKKYLALAHGKVDPAVGIINAPIDRNPFNRMRRGVFPGGREAVTDYKAIKIYKQHTLLELTPHTGRTHQIRVHLKYINHSIVSDPLYSGRKNLQLDLKICPRLFLHAASLQIKHPLTNEILSLKSPLPEDLQNVLDKI